MPAIDRISELAAGSVELARMHAAAAIVAECRHVLAASAGGVLGEIAAGEVLLTEWRHYPAGEVYDPQTHGQYFYHAHPAADRPAPEHGHFHTFLRAEGMPLGVAPLVLPEMAVVDALRPPPQAAPIKHGARDEVSHLVAIALDPRGEPIRLFTTNRWVTGETWYRADDVIRMLDRFTIGEAGPSTVLNRWIGGMVGLFRPQIAALLRRRDETVMAWRRRRRTNVFEDPRIEITSSLDIDVGTQFAMLERARLRQSGDSLARAPGSAGAGGLSWMEEGWGDTHAG